MQSDAPEGRCRFVSRPDSLGVEWEGDLSAWDRMVGASSCYREASDDGRCLWHAPVASKDTGDLLSTVEGGRLDGARLSGVELVGVPHLAGRSLRHAKLDGAVLARTDLDGTDLANADLSGAVFREAELDGARLHGTDCTDADFGGASLRGANLGKADLSGADLTDADLTGAYLRGADLTDATLDGTTLSRIDAQWTDLSGLELEDVTVEEAALRGADLSGGTFHDVSFAGSDLYRGSLAGTLVAASDVSDTTLAGTDLSGADFSNSSLAGSYLDGAVAQGTMLGGTTLTGTYLHDAHLADVYVNESTALGRSGYEADALDQTPPQLADRLRHASTAGIRLRAAVSEAQTTDLETTDADATDLETTDADDTATGRIARLRTRLGGVRRSLRRGWYLASVGAPVSDYYARQFSRAGSDYRTLRSVLRENELPERTATANVRAKDADRLAALSAGAYGRWLRLAGERWVMGYGERVQRVLASSALVVLSCALSYPLFGLTNTRPDARLATISYWTADWGDTAYVLGKSLYFSVTTFTTLGYGDVQPRGFAELVATGEAAVGSLLLALLVFVLGRRATR